MDPSETDQSQVTGEELKSFENLLADIPSDDSKNAQDAATGRTVAHSLAEKASTVGAEEAVKKLLEKGLNLAIKDATGKSSLDILASTEEGAAAVRKLVVKPLLTLEMRDKLHDLMITGWADITLNNDEDLDAVEEEVKETLGKVKAFQATLSTLQNAIKEGKIEDVGALSEMEPPMLELLLSIQNQLGLPALHQAVLCQNSEAVTHIVTVCPQVLKIKDNMQRTALHYAAALQDGEDLLQILKNAGGDDSLQDLSGKSPMDYKTQPQLLSVTEMKGRLEALADAVKAESDSRPQSSADRAADGVKPSVEAEVEETVQVEAPQEPEPPKTPPKPATPPGPKQHEPVKMYVGRTTERQVPPPTTVDGKYMAQHLGSALTMALAEIAEKRPRDPIEYLANWLYKHHANTAHTKKQEELLLTIRNEEEKQKAEEEDKFKRKEELMRIQEDELQKRQEEEEERKRQEQEEMLRNAKEANLAQKPLLPTVTEEGEADADAASPADLEPDDDPEVKDRDDSGQTEMHKLASQQGIDLNALLDLGFSVADRDLNGKTVRDIAQEANRSDTVASIDQHVTRLLEEAVVEKLEQLALEGYDNLEPLVKDSMPEATQTFITRLPGLKEQMSTALGAAESGNEEELKEALDALPQLAFAKDKNGRTILHLAVLCGKKSLVEYIGTKFPGSLKARDNVNRSALHYAYAVSDDIAQSLLTLGASPKARDARKKLPSYYKDNRPDIVASSQTPETSQDNEDAKVNIPAENKDESQVPTDISTNESEPQAGPISATTTVTVTEPEQSAITEQ